nr:MAG TPA: hypothetical protein [Bacteriophage sp.]
MIILNRILATCYTLSHFLYLILLSFVESLYMLFP